MSYFEPNYLLDYKVLKILNDSTYSLMMPNEKERKTNINNVKPCSTTESVENACDPFLGCIKTQHENFNYILRPQL